MRFMKKKNRCDNCVNNSVKLDKDKKHTENMPEKFFSYGALRTT